MANWDPTTQTGHTKGTPRNWTTTIAAQTGTLRTATPSNVNTVIGQCIPGDVVRLTNGTYGAITVNVSGTSANKIVIVAENPGTYGTRNVHVTAARIIINGSHIIIGGFKYTWGTAQGNMIQLLGASIELTDCDIQDITTSAGRLRMIVVDNNASNAHIHHNWIKNINAVMAIALEGVYPSPYPTGVIIEYNTMQDLMEANPGGLFLQLGNLPWPYASNHDLMVTGTIFRYNVVLRCDSAEIKTAGNLIYRNWFKDNTGKVMTFRAGDNNVFEGNLSDNCRDGLRILSKGQVVINNVFINNNGEAAINVGEGSLYSQMGVIYNAQHERAENILIANNVIIGGTNRGIRLGDPTTGRSGSTHPQPYSPKNVWIYNNIISTTTGVAIYFQTPDSVPHSADGYPTNVSGYHQYVGCEVKNNDIYVTGAAVVGDNSSDGGVPTGYINWNHGTMTSGSVISGNVETNPLLASTYRVLSSSPCINAGVAYSKNSYSSASMYDWDGDARTFGALPDIGVDEFGSNVDTPTSGLVYLYGGVGNAFANTVLNIDEYPGLGLIYLNGGIMPSDTYPVTGVVYWNGSSTGVTKSASHGKIFFNGGALQSSIGWAPTSRPASIWTRIT